MSAPSAANVASASASTTRVPASTPSRFHAASTPMRQPATPAPAVSSGTGISDAVGSSGSAPAMAPSRMPASMALRAMVPTWSSDAASSAAPWRLTRPHVGFSPVRPFAADGQRIDPPVSEASEPYAMPAATATPEPLDEMPGQ